MPCRHTLRGRFGLPAHRVGKGIGCNQSALVCCSRPSIVATKVSRPCEVVGGMITMGGIPCRSQACPSVQDRGRRERTSPICDPASFPLPAPRSHGRAPSANATILRPHRVNSPGIRCREVQPRDDSMKDDRFCPFVPCKTLTLTPSTQALHAQPWGTRFDWRVPQRCRPRGRREPEL
jgi:hypothetical protein